MPKFIRMCRRRSPKSEDDKFVFPEPNLRRPLDRSDVESLTKQQFQRPTTSATATQHHLFSESRPVSDLFFLLIFTSESQKSDRICKYNRLFVIKFVNEKFA